MAKCVETGLPVLLNLLGSNPPTGVSCLGDARLPGPGACILVCDVGRFLS